MNSFRRAVRRGVHQALDFGDGCDRGAVLSIVAECSKGGGEPLVELVRGRGLGGGRDEPVLEFIRQSWPVRVLPAWPGFVVVRSGAA